MTVFPVKSIRAAPGGACISPFLPTLAKRSFSTTKAELSIGEPPSPMLSRAPSNSVALRVCCPHATKEHHTINMPPKIFRARIVPPHFLTPAPDHWTPRAFLGVEVITHRNVKDRRREFYPAWPGRRHKIGSFKLAL